MKVAGLVVAGVLVVSMAACGDSGSGTASKDPKGVQACKLMLADKKSGLTPDDDRSNQEIMLLTESKTLALRNAASQLTNTDTSVAFNAPANLYTGCAQVGVPLN